MTNLRNLLFFVAIVALIPVALHASEANGRAPGPRFLDGLTLVILDTDDIASLHTARNTIHSLGGHIAIMAPPSVLIGWIPEDSDGALYSQPGVMAIHRGPVSMESVAVRQPIERAMVGFFNRALRGEVQLQPYDAGALLDSEAEFGHLPDVFDPPPIDYDAYIDNLRGQGLDPSALQERGLLLSSPSRSTMGNSDYMTGTVAVTIFFVESDGSGADPDTYTWIPEHMQSYLDGAAAGLAWWSSEATTVTGCSVSWLLNYYSGADPRCQQWVEPILHDSNYHSIWVDNVITNFGYTSGNRFAKVTAFNTWQRSYYGTDRSFSAFVPYNPPPAPQTFVGGGAAFAYLGGPYSVLLFRAGWTVPQVFAHETGHIFWACDEYADGCSSCTATCGNGIPNANCETCNPNSRDCMMKANTYNTCSYTEGQVGWGIVSPCTPPPPPPLPAPVASTASPGEGQQGIDVTITVTGSNFFPGSVVDLGDNIFVHTTNLVGNEQLVIDVTILNEAPLGSVDVTVRNKDGQTSTLPGAFEILPTLRHYYSPSGANVFPYVTPATAATTLADAITAAFDGDTLFVPTTTLDVTTLSISKGVLLHGAWNSTFTQRDLATGKTVINLNGNVLVYPNTFGGGLDGFIVQNGHGTPGSQPFAANFGGGVKILSAAAVVANCEIRMNAATNNGTDGMGGGVYAYNSTVEIRDNSIHDNTATQGAGIYLHTCSGSVSGNTVSANTVTGGTKPAEGGGLMIVNCSALSLADNSISDNIGATNGGGLRVKKSSAIDVAGGTVTGNQAMATGGGGGGVAVDSAAVTIAAVDIAGNQAALIGGGLNVSGGTSNIIVRSCRVANNNALLGGGCYVGGGTASVNHNLFVSNAGSASGGGLVYSGSVAGTVIGNTMYGNTSGGVGGMQLGDLPLDVFNNIVTNSTGSGISCSGTTLLSIGYNLAWNNSGADFVNCASAPGHISADPVFVDAAAGDYHLGLSSPAIDSGNPDPAYDDPDGSRGDMGRFGSHDFLMEQPSYVKNLRAEATSPDVTLRWAQNPEPDVQSYAIYCDTTTGFVPSVANFVALVPAADSSATVSSPGDSAFYRVAAVNTSGYAGGYSAEAFATPATGIGTPLGKATYALLQNVPNPFNPVTRITYELPKAVNVQLDIYDVTGQLVRRLVSSRQGPGRFDTEWNGETEAGTPAASGIYLYRLRAGDFFQTRKMVLLK